MGKKRIADWLRGKTKTMAIAIGIIAVVIAIICIWNGYFAPTRIAFVNYQATTLGQIVKSNNCSFIKIEEVPLDGLRRLKHADMVMINGMGLRLTAEQRQQVEEIAMHHPLLTTAATDPQNYIVSLDSAVADSLVHYLNNGGRHNYRNMLLFIRRIVDGKHAFCDEPQPVVSPQRYRLYHPNLTHPDEEEDGFVSVKDYEEYLQQAGILSNDKPHIVITGQMGDPTDLISALEDSGMMVYPVHAMQPFVLSGQIDSVQPAAIINMAHGRLGDYMTAWLTAHNVPLFTTVYIPQLTEDWLADPMGMSGGFLSQSIVTPEIDGAIRPYTLFAHRISKEGIQEIYTIPERLHDFVLTLQNHIVLQRKANADKRIAIYYFKGPGQNALTASGLEVVPSLHRFLLRLKAEGYRVEGLPATADSLASLIQSQGAVLGTYAEGAFDHYLQQGNPQLITAEQYNQWANEAFPPTLQSDVAALYGAFPGEYMATAEGHLAVARVQLGNIMLLPQPMAGLGSNSFQIVHGTEQAPPYPYIASYLYTRFGFKADAVVHFGTHGSLEYTPRKQAALSPLDWPDRLIGTLPHLYLYTTGNVGESLLAKRRSYATLISHLTAPFLDNGTRSTYRQLSESIKTYYHQLEHNQPTDQQALAIKRIAVGMGLHRSLDLDSNLATPWDEATITRLDNFAEELAEEKMTGHPYTLGQPYSLHDLESSVRHICTDPIAYSLLALDKLRGTAPSDAEKHKSLFTQRYLQPARQIVDRLLSNPTSATDGLVCQVAGITQADLAHAREVHAAHQPIDMLSMMRSMAEEMPGAARTSDGSNMKPRNPSQEAMRRMGRGTNPEKAMKMAKMMGASDEALAKMKAAMSSPDTVTPAPTTPQMSDEERNDLQRCEAIIEIERTILNIGRYRTALLTSPQAELDAMVNALNGGFIAPSPGGDPIVNPNVLPTGRNLYGINAENTPSESAWEKGRLLAENTIAMYRQRHHDSIPRKVSYTLWSGEFIETEGATIAQVLYMLGVEPIRDAFGRVTDLRIIPSAELGRPRIDVCVQTSGQLRDIAASRLFLIDRAVRMAAEAHDETDNYVSDGIRESERRLTESGLSPSQAREVAAYRVFGGIDGSYGTGIQSMVQAGDQWEAESEIANTYLHNMGAYYGSHAHWEQLLDNAFAAALAGTDAVVQPRQSNTWGALSLDHVYEFMGGMSLAVRNLSGKDPDAYLSDYRNRNNARLQEVKEAIGVESRTTLFNPNYIRQMMQGGASSASTFAELVQNTYGWNVMKPQAIDNQMWDEIYEVYVKDKHHLGVVQYFESQNPAALQEMTATMMESARKGLWKATDVQLSDIAALHTALIEQYQPSCSGTVCNNAKLRQYIADHTSPDQAARYQQSIATIRQPAPKAAADDKGMKLKREQLQGETESNRTSLSNLLVAVGAAVAIVIAVVLILRRRKREANQ